MANFRWWLVVHLMMKLWMKVIGFFYLPCQVVCRLMLPSGLKILKDHLRESASSICTGITVNLWPRLQMSWVSVIIQSKVLFNHFWEKDAFFSYRRSMQKYASWREQKTIFNVNKITETIERFKNQREILIRLELIIDGLIKIRMLPQKWDR